MVTYKTPGVYVHEIDTFPPSVAQVSTAIPAFIGYTETGPSSDVKIARIDTFLDYKTQFGGAQTSIFYVEATINNTTHLAEITSVSRTHSDKFSSPPDPAQNQEFYMYHSIDLYFKNGGGSCYIVSIGNYKDPDPPLTKADPFLAGLDVLAKEDEPTLIVPVDAALLPATEYEKVCQGALRQCNTLGDRFAIMDVKSVDTPDTGKTILETEAAHFRTSVSDHLMYGAAYIPYLQTALSYDYDDADVHVYESPPATTTTLDKIKTSNTALYSQIQTALSQQYMVLPPSGAMAGIYAAVDRDRGVWKAPANVGVSSIIGPVTKITNEEQEDLNVDPSTGKSINAIRAFTGKGTLVWGARTLAGNDNNWRYVPVRRLFITIEESVRKAASFAVFEPNDATTWLKVKAMVESYLYGLWEQGALAGSTDKAAYFVNVGLGKTMTDQDILEGNMIIEVGIAAVRPAEFVVFRFSQKMQEA